MNSAARLVLLLDLYRLNLIKAEGLLIESLLVATPDNVEEILNSLPEECLPYIIDLPFHCPPDLQIVFVEDPTAATSHFKSLLPIVERWLRLRQGRDQR
jgi:hypothetical protein